jgi:hypothetical protein
MLRIPAIVALLAVSTSGASALCISYPDDGSTNYVENRTAHMLCLQRELARDTELAAERRESKRNSATCASSSSASSS